MPLTRKGSLKEKVNRLKKTLTNINFSPTDKRSLRKAINARATGERGRLSERDIKIAIPRKRKRKR